MYQDGSCSAFVQIYRRHRGSAEAVCRRHLHPADVEDAVQETMLRALEGLMRFNGDYALRAWINRIAANVCLDVLRKRRRRTTAQRLELVTGEGAVAADPSEAVESLMEAEEVGAAFARLPDRQQRALFLRGVEGQSHVEIAAALGVSAAQVKAIIHRARLSLRRQGSRRGWGRGVLALLPWGRYSELGGFSRRFPHLTEHPAAAAGSPALVQSVSDGYRVLATALVATVAAVVGTGAVPLDRAPWSHGPAHGLSLAEEPVVATASPADVVITSTGEVLRSGGSSEPFVGPLTGPSEASPTRCDPEVGVTAEDQLQPGFDCSSTPPLDRSQPAAAPTAADGAPPETRTTTTADGESSPEPAPLTSAVTSTPRLAPGPAVPAAPRASVARSRPAVPLSARAPVAQSRPAVPAAARAPVAPPRADSPTTAARGAPAATPRPAVPATTSVALESVPPADVPETGPGVAQGRRRPGP